MPGNVGFIVGPELILDIHTVLTGLTYPANDDTGLVPDVYFEGTFYEQQDEQIELLGAVNDGDIEWANSGHIQEESFTVSIQIRSAIPGKTGPQALARCVVLSKIIEAGFRNQTTGQPTGLTDTRVLQTYRFVGYDTDPFPVGDTGWGYDLTLRLRVKARH